MHIKYFYKVIYVAYSSVAVRYSSMHIKYFYKVIYVAYSSVAVMIIT